MFDYPEGATPIDEDEKEGLLIRSIGTREELNAWEQRNITDAYSWLDRTRRKDYLSAEFIRTLHEKMFGKVWAWAGDYRRTDKNIGVDWSQIPIHLRQLLDDVRYWIDNETYPSDEIAIRFHHRLVFIHLFPNGNGRHARVMTDVLLEEILDNDPFGPDYTPRNFNVNKATWKWRRKGTCVP
jgi:Fic-DOC domain mobile mystery protein B